MSRALSPNLANRIIQGRPIDPGTVRLMEYLPPLRGERSVSGYVDGSYLSVNVETTAANCFTVRGFLRGEPIDFHVATTPSELSISTAVPELSRVTAEAIWRLVAAELVLPAEPVER